MILLKPETPKPKVKKGGTKTDEIEDFDKKLYIMKENRHLNIKELNDLSTIFNEIVTYITGTYETPSLYEEIYNKVKAIFEDVKDEPITPGTILAYFIGCMVSSLIVPSACSALCVGAIPKIDDIENRVCDYTIYVATFNNDKFTFTMMNDTNNKQDVIIYVTFDNIIQFPGFSTAEKNALESRGVEMVNIISFYPKPGEYNELTSGFLPISDVKMKKEEESETNGFYVGVIIISIFAIVLFIVFILFIIKSIKKQEIDW